MEHLCNKAAVLISYICVRRSFIAYQLASQSQLENDTSCNQQVLTLMACALRPRNNLYGHRQLYIIRTSFHTDSRVAFSLLPPLPPMQKSCFSNILVQNVCLLARLIEVEQAEVIYTCYYADYYKIKHHQMLMTENVPCLLKKLNCMSPCAVLQLQSELDKHTRNQSQFSIYPTTSVHAHNVQHTCITTQLTAIHDHTNTIAADRRLLFIQHHVTEQQTS